MTTVSHRSRSVGVGRELGHLEGAEDPPSKLQRVVDRLHARRVPGELVVAEVGLRDAAGHDQAVVGDLDLVEVGGGGGVDDAAVEIEAGHLGQLDSNVAVLAHDVAQRLGDLSRRQHSRGDLVQQGLEEVVVAAVDQRHVDGSVPEGADGGQATESPSDNDHPMAGCGFGAVHGRLQAGAGVHDAAVGEDGGGRQVAGPRSGQERDHRTDLLGFGHASEWDGLVEGGHLGRVVHR